MANLRGWPSGQAGQGSAVSWLGLPAAHALRPACKSSKCSPTTARLLPARTQEYGNRVKIEYTVDAEAPEGWAHERGHISK